MQRSGPGCPDNKIPGLALDSKVLKVRDSVPQQQLKEEEREEQKKEKEYEMKPKIKRSKAMKDEEVWQKQKKKTQRACNDGKKDFSFRWSQMKWEEELDEDEGEQEPDEDTGEEKIQRKKTTEVSKKFQKETEEKVWTELLQFLNEKNVEVIVKNKRPKRTTRKKVKQICN